MKKQLITIIAVSFLFVGCGGNSTPTVDGTTTEEMKQSLKVIRDSIPKDEQDKMITALFKISMSVTGGLVNPTAEDDKKIREILHGKTAHEIFEYSKSIKETTASKAAVNLFKIGQKLDEKKEANRALAAWDGLRNIEAVKQHLAAGADVNVKDKYGDTPLHRAANEEHNEVVELLLANGADVNAKDKYGKTPLHAATTKEIAELLIAKGADVTGWSWEKAQRIACVNNLKQIGIATRIYAVDNQDRFPWQVPQAEGTAEIAQPRSDTDALLDSDGEPIFDANAWLHFQALSNELSNPKVLRCPRDESRTQANSFQSTPPQRCWKKCHPLRQELR